MSRPPRAARAPETEERRARRAVPAAAGLVVGAGMAVVAPLAAPAGAAADYREQVVVEAADADGASTDATLRGGTTYDILVDGVFAFPAGEADAECTRTDGNVVWVADGGAPSLELLVGGEDQRWVPVGPPVFGCDSSSHRYRLSWTPVTDGPLALRVDGGDDQSVLEGSLLVAVTGPGIVEPAPGSDTSDAPSEPPAPPADGSGDPAAGAPAPPPDAGQPPATEVAPTTLTRPAAAAPVEPSAPTAPNRTDVVDARPNATARREDLIALLLGEAAPTPAPVTVELATGAGLGAGAPASQSGASMPLLLTAALVGAAAVGLAMPARARRPVRLPVLRRRRTPHAWRPVTARPVPTAASALERSYF